MTELGLGTVQFGVDYGITNASGELSDDVVVEMLRVAQKTGLTLFDTAADYGSSQKRLGHFFPPGDRPKYVTKFSLPTNGAVPTAENLYGASRTQLGAETLHAVLFHKLSDLADSRCGQAVQILRGARESGVVSRIGVSVYNARDLDIALDVFPDLDIVQLPASILDLRLLESDVVSHLRESGVEIHVRSVFLQGLLLLDPERLTPYFQGLQPALRFLHQRALDQKVSIMTLLLGAMRQHPAIDAVLVGATSVGELEVITRSWGMANQTERLQIPPVPAELLDPRNWPADRLLS